MPLEPVIPPKPPATSPKLPRRRWGYDLPPHPEIKAILETHREIFAATLNEIDRHRDFLRSFGWHADPSKPYAPLWNNWYFSSLDAAALVALILSRRPRQLIEIGSGNSTRFARQAINFGGLATKILSVDPQPRYEIDAICDSSVRTKLQHCDLTPFYDLQANDMILVDGSHYLAPDSDVVILFLEILPRLKPGVLVQLHDVFWPYDYSQRWNLPLNEQYMLGLMLLAKPLPFKIVLASQFVSTDPELSAIMRRTFEGHDGYPSLPLHYPDAPDFLSRTFWFETTPRSSPNQRELAEFTTTEGIKASQVPTVTTQTAARRWGFDVPPHPEIRAVLERHRSAFATTLTEIAAHRDFLHSVGIEQDPSNPHFPLWNNGYYTALDAAALSGLLLSRRPRWLIEVGSGNSTRFARRAIEYGNLPTELISIDPEPRYEIDKLCDKVIRAKLQDCDQMIFDGLEAGDILFIDSSHYVEPDSDVVVFFLEILPRLKPGILVHVHDIFWPCDYTRRWAWAINEQYMIGVMLLMEPMPFKVVLPNYFVNMDPGLNEIVRDMFAGQGGSPDLPLAYPGGPEIPGVSFWFETVDRLE